MRPVSREVAYLGRRLTNSSPIICRYSKRALCSDGRLRVARPMNSRPSSSWQRVMRSAHSSGVPVMAHSGMERPPPKPKSTVVFSCISKPRYWAAFFSPVAIASRMAVSRSRPYGDGAVRGEGTCRTVLFQGLTVHGGKGLVVFPLWLGTDDGSVAHASGTADGSPALSRNPDWGMGLLYRQEGKPALMHLPMLTLECHIFTAPKHLHKSQRLLEAAGAVAAVGAECLQFLLAVTQSQA